MTLPPPRKTLPPRRSQSSRRLAVPYRYDRRRPAWIPLSLVVNGVLMSWWGSSLVRPVAEVPQRVQASPLVVAQSDIGSSNLGSSSISSNSDSNSPATPRLRLTYDQWVEQLHQEAVAVQGSQNLSILAGDSLSLWFPNQLLPHDQLWLNQGISGETSRGLSRRLGLWQRLEPKRIFVMIGINDLLKGDAPDGVLNNQRQIIHDLRKAHPGAALVVQSLLPHSGPQARWEGRAKLDRIPNEQIRSFNRQLAAIAKTEGAYYLDLNPLFSNDQGFLRQELTTDGLHLNDQGYLVWSTALNFFSLQQLNPESSRQAAVLVPSSPSSPAPVTAQPGSQPSASAPE